MPVVSVAWDEGLLASAEVHFVDGFEDASITAFGRSGWSWCDPGSLVSLANALGYVEADPWITGAEE